MFWVYTQSFFLNVMNTVKKVNLICPASKATMISVAVTLTSNPTIHVQVALTVINNLAYQHNRFCHCRKTHSLKHTISQCEQLIPNRYKSITLYKMLAYPVPFWSHPCHHTKLVTPLQSFCSNWTSGGNL